MRVFRAAMSDQGLALTVGKQRDELYVNISTISESEEPLDSSGGTAMPFSNPQLALAILSQATTGRPIVLSKGIGGAWALQCNGVHFIQDPTNKQEVAVV